MPSGWGIGGGVIALAEVAMATTNPAAAINLIIVSSLRMVARPMLAVAEQ
jgi:hypothetical protein